MARGLVQSFDPEVKNGFIEVTVKVLAEYAAEIENFVDEETVIEIREAY